MPLLYFLLFAVLVNFPSSVLAQEKGMQIRGPRTTDTPPQVSVGPLSPSDTLWRVAERIKPEGNISLYQVMYALYLKNPDAFLEGNLNHLRPGAVLLLPTQREIQQVDLNIAREKSERDDREWAARQKSNTAKKSVADSTGGQAQTAPQWQADLARLDQKQRQELDRLRGQFADSMQQLEVIVEENLQLKNSLAKVEHELALIQAQLGEDSEIQQQLTLLLQQQTELLQAKAAEEADAAEQTDWQKWFKNPLAWVLAACIPALMVLFGILLWVKKRSRRSEDVINAAVTEPVKDPTYHSPLPPLDESNDLDESLFEIDDALLEDAFNDSAVTEEPAIEDDMLDFDDSLSFEDDSLLPAESKAETDADTELDEFDPDNILSDTDLSALLAAEDDDDAIIELADDDLDLDDGQSADDQLSDELQELAEPALTASVLEEPSDAAVEEQLHQNDFDIDDIIEEIDLDDLDVEEPAIPAAPLQEQVQAPELTPEPTADDADDAFADIATETLSDSFDSSELEAFAEGLVAESTASGTASAADDLDNNKEAMLSAELAELLDQVDDLGSARETELAPEEDEDTALDSDADVLSDEHDDVLLIDTNEDDTADNSLSSLDLTASDDESVVRPTDAALSVENPSKILEQYPELELTEEELLTEGDTDFSDMPELDADLLLQDLDDADDSDSESQNDDVQELDPLPDAQFDSLMSELEAMTENLDATESVDEQVEPLAGAQTSDDGFDFADDDFVEIDSLLANAQQQEQDTERFTKLNVDVGLDDYADIIGEHERRDVDNEDNGYSAKLDLVRAYIEMDDTESAELMLDEILASDAPEHVKKEAQGLKQ